MPLKVHPEVDQLTATFNERGKAYVDITSKPFCHMMAKGRTLDEPSQDLDTQVIVDLTLALRSNEEWRIKDEISESHLTQNDTMEVSERPYCGHRYQPPGCCGSDVLHDDCELERIRSSLFILESGNIFRSLSLSEITDSHYVLVKPHVYAFVLRHRQWVTLSVSDLSPVIFSNIFDDLRIPEEHKTAVQALVRTHEAGKAQVLPGQAQSVGAALELVAGKGRGLIILLHGPPGVGKTSTAECVADNTKRPLYPITPGDIGETAAEVERNLHHHFQFAQKWGCVLLLDEADVFLTKRTKLDLRHNAVTSVFLRSLEYYSGILFLTTNRVGVMDLAFKSRIQMTLWYPKLSREVTLELYQMFINRTKKEQKDKNSYQFKIKEKEILQFAAKHFDYLEKHKLDTWNGRYVTMHCLMARLTGR
jgi:GTPase SAR1 family protein